MPEDAGNDNVFTTFKGKYVLETVGSAQVTSENVMLSCVNDVVIMTDVVLEGYMAGEDFVVLPEECRPANTCVLCAYFMSSEGGGSFVPVQVSSTGGMSLDFDADGELHLNGLSFNISGCWYQ